MLTKTRTTIITLIASASFATAALAPAVASAQKIDSGGTHAATCEVRRLTYEMLDELQESAFANGQYDLAAYYAEEETAAKNAATAEGCSWPVAALAHVVKVSVTVTKPVARKPAAR